MAGRVWLPARSLVKFPRYFMASSSPRLRLAHPKLDRGTGRAVGIERRWSAMSLVLALLGAARAALRTHTNLALENLALRQQLALLRHRSKRPRFGRLERAFWVWLSRRWAGCPSICSDRTWKRAERSRPVVRLIRRQRSEQTSSCATRHERDEPV